MPISTDEFETGTAAGDDDAIAGENASDDDPAPADDNLTGGENDTGESAAGDLDADVAFGCYYVEVDAESYEEVTLHFENGESVTFDGGYEGTTSFAHQSHRGDDRSADASPADETFEEFHGAIERVEVAEGDDTATAESDVEACVSELSFACSEVTLDGGDGPIQMDGARINYTDGSEVAYTDGDFGADATIGTPGRTVETMALERTFVDGEDASQQWYVFENPDSDCEPEGESPVTFECGQVTVEENPFSVSGEHYTTTTIHFADGSSRDIELDRDPGYPTEINATGNGTGSAIEAVEIRRMAWGSSVYLTNPDPGECPSDPEDAVEFVDCQTLEVSGEFEDVELGIGTYNDAGYDTYAYSLDPSEGETTFPDDVSFQNDGPVEGINGYFVRYAQVSGGGDSFRVDNPNRERCAEEIRPQAPTTEYVDAEPLDDGIEVTFEYENPNTGEMDIGVTSGQSAFVEGTTGGEPPKVLDPGAETFTVVWTPESEDERLVWEIDASPFGVDEPITAETPTAGELHPELFETGTSEDATDAGDNGTAVGDGLPADDATDDAIGDGGVENDTGDGIAADGGGDDQVGDDGTDDTFGEDGLQEDDSGTGVGASDGGTDDGGDDEEDDGDDEDADDGNADEDADGGDGVDAGGVDDGAGGDAAGEEDDGGLGDEPEISDAGDDSSGQPDDAEGEEGAGVEDGESEDGEDAESESEDPEDGEDAESESEDPEEGEDVESESEEGSEGEDDDSSVDAETTSDDGSENESEGTA